MADLKDHEATDFNLARSAFQPIFSCEPEHLRRRAREKLAARYLRRHGNFKILYRNFRGHRGGEIGSRLSRP